MLKTVKHIVLAAGVIMLAASCGKNYLSTPPVGSLSTDGFYTTPAHLESGVLGVYAKLQNIENGQYLTFSEDRSDNIWVDSDPNGIRTCSESSFYRITDATGEIGSLWAGWYSLIYNANTVLASLDQINMEPKMINQFKGELLFLRGLAHFELARMFGNVPIVDHVLSSQEAKELKQSPAIEVIAAAVADLAEAEKLLPMRKDMINSSNGNISADGRADLLSTQALLARVYMTLKGYPFNDASAKVNAKAYLEKVLANGASYFAPDMTAWKKQFLTDNATANKYQIFAIQHRLGTGLQVTFESGTMIKNLDIVADGYHSGSEMSPVYPEGTLRYEFVKENDPRGLGFSFIDGYDKYGDTPAYVNRTTTFDYNGEKIKSFEASINAKWCPTKPKRKEMGIQFDDTQLGTGTGSLNKWPVNFPILRLEDMMLLYAELLVEDGNINGALEQVNKIRNRAGITPATASNKEEAMKAVKLERQLELYLEGVRWFDMVRYGEWKNLTLAKYNNYRNEDGSLRTNVSLENVKDGRYLLPIPKSETAAVPGLYKQNPDW